MISSTYIRKFIIQQNKNLKNILYTVFIIVYLGSFFFCIFFQIESWPFSDYRLFPHKSHPNRVHVYLPYFQLSNGQFFDPLKNRHLSLDRSYFNKVFRFKSLAIEPYIRNLIQSKKMEKAIKKMEREGLVPVKFIPMLITFKKSEKNKWEPVLKPVTEYDIRYKTKNK